ncbi:DUF2269 domain-containing protein [Mesorhizobium sp. M4B.F.Ca.ET.215.01.1.1]|uniref:DUF2269 family protein n=2 Tax=Mesorhizobium TaxID=68287 RepID=UPI000FC9C41C|nr:MULTISPECIES: DUF2269 domain-containing protein [unclassified Mesorhizobium]RUW21172.1 DUF2269 domain-containing protein [Mesorhizobium sp. M4B.F.Ca.ET.013.02.1.1]RVD35958.1 DUF2269 domain-containing protein [Mesorhizobium sp. M4B.F.Ca.ET.019.03.1.1]TGQ06243.1 DUF2269 domain-containing protein [Mesorhizobium sp. M4B.F.Ca.ET.215.01.1.1]TGQ32637.1 DUF2269 domain-containing protein [Mesorhizobium sp. M00.F.Ca.ET.220.01.1.1]TGQ98851.1 DUF2269 domain-containing protein [Mesorhizobium sp. M4B.F.C
MALEDVLRLVHVLGATVLFGTGIGIAFFMAMAVRTRDPRIIAHVASIVVIADTVFTATAVVLQPLTGYGLARVVGWPLNEGWILLSLALYVIIGLFWVPVVWIQIRLRDMARHAAAEATALPPGFDRLYRVWFAFGFPAFFAVVAIFWLMLTKPTIMLLGLN